MIACTFASSSKGSGGLAVSVSLRSRGRQDDDIGRLRRRVGTTHKVWGGIGGTDDQCLETGGDLVGFGLFILRICRCLPRRLRAPESRGSCSYIVELLLNA